MIRTAQGFAATATKEDLPLRALVKEPRSVPPYATIVLLHGRGSGPEEFMSRAEPFLEDDTRIVSLQGPIQQGEGWMWYAFNGRGADEKTLRISLSAIDRVTKAYCPVESAGVPTYLVGFSQGATVSLAFATMRPERIRGVVALSGFLVEDGLLPGPITNVRGMRIFIAHGRSDRSVPFAWSQAAKARLQAAGASIRFDIHEDGHAVPEEIWREAREWIMNDIKEFRARIPLSARVDVIGA